MGPAGGALDGRARCGQTLGSEGVETGQGFVVLTVFHAKWALYYSTQCLVECVSTAGRQFLSGTEVQQFVKISEQAQYHIVHGQCE